MIRSVHASRRGFSHPASLPQSPMALRLQILRSPASPKPCLIRGRSRSEELGSSYRGQAADGQWHPLGAAHRRALARHAKAVWQLELGLCALHPLAQAWGLGCCLGHTDKPRPPANEEHAIDSTIVRAHQHAAGAKGGIKRTKHSAVRAAASRQKFTFAPMPKANRSPLS